MKSSRRISAMRSWIVAKLATPRKLFGHPIKRKPKILILFYPLVGLAISVLSIGVLAKLSVPITWKRVLASFTIGFTLGFILSSFDDDEILETVLRYKRESNPRYADGKGALKRGKRINTIITAVVDFITAVVVMGDM